jgi:YHS domain-containing protein
LGGFGSGRHWFSRKTTVEECLTLDINKLVKDGLLDRSCGELRWCRGGEETAYLSYTLKDIGFKEGRSAYVLTIHSPIIRRGQRIPVSQNIPLVTTKLHSGGKRYWFSCPNCRRRVGRIHLPHGKSYFFCRRCYDLTYMSCQESHKFDWFFARIGVLPSVRRRIFKRD